jgi:uncharacterized protein involved in outer membrane biogenesis
MNARTVIRRSLLGLAVLAGLLVAALVVAAVLGISINAGPWREAIAEKATALIGRPVRLEGPLRLTVGLRPELTVVGITIANPPGFASPQFASLGRAHLLVELWPLLRDEISVIAVEAEDVKMRLEQAADGRVNWNFALAAAPAEQPQQVRSKPVRLEQIQRFTLRRIDAEFRSGGATRSFALDELNGQGARGQPLSIVMKGRAEKTFPYRVTIDGGSLHDLYRPDQPWPVQIGLEFAGTALNISGTLTNATTNAAAQVVFGMGAQDLSELERLLQTTFPPVGATGLSGRVTWAAGMLRIAELRGAMGRSTLEGELAFDLHGAKPRMKGALRMPVLDLSPFTAPRPAAPKPQKDDAGVAELRQSYSEVERQTFDLRQIAQYEGDLYVKVDRWLGVVGDVRDAELRIELHEGRLRAPVEATLADVPLSGELNIDAHQSTPAFSLWLGTQKSKLGRLAQVFAGVRGVEGELGRFRLTLEGQGNNLHDVVQNFAVNLELLQGRLSYGHTEGGKPVEIRVDAFRIGIPAGGKLTGTLRGSLVDTPMQARFVGGDLPTLTRETRWPLQVEAAATGAVFRLSGEIAAPQAASGTDISFELSAKRAGDVARWLGLSRESTAPVHISAHARVESDEWRLDRITARLGKTELHADLSRTGIDKHPLVQARVVVDQLDVPELEAMLPPADPKASVGNTLDLPILPQGINLFDSDVEVQVKQVRLRRAAITDVSFSGHIREGRMWPSPFSVKVAGTPFSGAIAVDLRGKVPEASAWIAAESVNLGTLLKELGAVESLDASVQLLRAELIGRGSRLGEMLKRSSLLAELEQGALALHDPNGKWNLPIKLSKGTARAEPGQPVQLDIDGAIDTTPIAIRVASGALPDFMHAARVPFSVAVDTAGSHLELSGSAALPITQQEAQLELTAGGARVDSLNQLARVELPPWGPWEIKGKFRASKAGYEIPDMRLQVGESRLNGRGSLITTGVRPRLAVELSAPQIQLNDFALGSFRFTDKKEKDKNKKDKPMSAEDMRGKAKDAAAEGQRLLSPQFMRQLDASLQVEVAQVLSGKDRLGSGTLNAQLADGRFALKPVQVNVPGGAVNIALTYEPSDTDVHLTTDVAIERLDYGILARRIKPDVNMQGLLSLNMTLDARSPKLDSIMQHADGRIDFTVWPRDLKAGIFDLWAVNLFVALLPTINPGSQSVVNCVVGHFNLQGGKLNHEALLVDTSRMRVSGQAQVDFGTEQLNLLLTPRAKQPQFFSLATPVKVDGTLTDFHIGVSGSDIAGTTLRFFTSWIVVPLEMLGGRGMPSNGADVCGNSLGDAKR